MNAVNGLRKFLLASLIFQAVLLLVALAVMWFGFKDEIEKNRTVGRRIECILLVNPEVRSPETVAECRRQFP